MAVNIQPTTVIDLGREGAEIFVLQNEHTVLKNQRLLAQVGHRI
jgi:hypothetical protein